MNINGLKVWLVAIRPKTLIAALGPVLLGTFMAIGDGVHNYFYALLCLAGAVLIQIGTNLTNDYFDYIKGADVPERKGPVRVTESGLIEPKNVLLGAFLVFFLSGICYFLLVLRGGVPIAVLGILALLSAVFYTAGPRPIGYIGLGEIFVIFFFGPVALGGTYFLQALEINPFTLLAGLGCGFISASILAVNNLRDIETDKACGKSTLAVRFGATFAKIEYALFIVMAAIIPMIIYSLSGERSKIMLASLIIVTAAPAIKTVSKSTDPDELNGCLAQTAKILLYYSVLFSIGWNI